MITIANIPSENDTIYELLYYIEVGLREFIIEVLETKIGPPWWRQCLPNDVKQTAKSGLQLEKKIKWSKVIPHHPMYYTDFPDLKKIITKGDNWRNLFQPIFGREDLLISTLSELEPIRNKIAHNRKATTEDLAIVETAYKKIVTAIEEEKFYELVNRCTLAEDVPASLLSLEGEAEQAFKICLAYEPMIVLENWERIRMSWWFNADYLENEISAIEEYFKTLHAYKQLPRLRGHGHKIEAWVNKVNIRGKYMNAMQQLAEILKGKGDM